MLLFGVHDHADVVDVSLGNLAFGPETLSSERSTTEGIFPR